jgi:hypothetical protein
MGSHRLESAPLAPVSEHLRECPARSACQPRRVSAPLAPARERGWGVRGAPHCKFRSFTDAARSSEPAPTGQCTPGSFSQTLQAPPRRYIWEAEYPITLFPNSRSRCRSLVSLRLLSPAPSSSTTSFSDRQQKSTMVRSGELAGETYSGVRGDCAEASRRASRPAYPNDGAVSLRGQRAHVRLVLV